MNNFSNIAETFKSTQQNNTFKCFCCYNTIQKPYISKCGHTFHYSCFINDNKKYNGKTVHCPKCKIEFNYVENNKKVSLFYNEINNLLNSPLNNGYFDDNNNNYINYNNFDLESNTYFNDKKTSKTNKITPYKIQYAYIRFVVFVLLCYIICCFYLYC